MVEEHYRTILLVFQRITTTTLQLLQSSKCVKGYTAIYQLRDNIIIYVNVLCDNQLDALVTLFEFEEFVWRLVGLW